MSKTLVYPYFTASATGNTITTASGLPFTVGGSATKVAVFNGDIDVTGVIDPKGITFSRQSTNPLPPGQDGFWVNSSGQSMYTQGGVGTTNVSAALAGATNAGSTQPTLENQSGSTIAKAVPVKIDALGYIAPIDPSVEADAFAIVGVTNASIADNTTGKVVSNGLLENITTSASYGDSVFVAKDGSLTNVKPSIGVGGFVAGDWVIRVGVISRNVTTPSQKDLLVNITIVGQL